VRCYFFHLMPWPHLPPGFAESGESAWVTLSNATYDPAEGHRLYNRYLDELELADRLGFHGICVNEHHQNAYGNIPSPNVMAAALVRRTQRARIAILGNALPLRDHPLRVAEEVAMLDVISGGRIISGFVRGLGAEYHSFNVNPTYSRERFLEAHDLIVRAWTEPGPFAWDGRHYQLRYVNLWPRPLQKPHPPIFLPTQGSGETIRWAAAPERRYPLIQTFNEIRNVERNFAEYRAAAAEYGYEASPLQLGWAMPTYVAETDEQARAEAGPHLESFFNDLLRMPSHLFFPPGYLSEASMEKVLAAKGRLGSGRRTYEELLRDGYVLAGSARTVTETLRAHFERLRFGHLMVVLQFAGLSHELTVRNVERFARDVMPHLAGLGEP
jgi:alkanesulfonate monooxygenase SsuD/methylene tetrahydromethanopterin reductase-like flavin-dependent oxidoreductase (luciferase family)